MTDKFQDNPLNKFANPTYHIRFYCVAEATSDGNTADQSFQQFSTLQTANVTIAESGVTGYNITSLTIDALWGSGDATRNTTATAFQMVIHEPNGTSFLDAMYEAVLSLGVSNWLKCNYYIDVSFRGYNEDGSLNTNLVPGLTNSGPNGAGVWTYEVRINQIDCDVGAGGSSYTLQGVMSYEQAFMPEMGRLPANINVTAQNFGDFLQGLANQLNAINQAQYQTITSQNSTSSSAQLYTYAFQVLDYPSGTDGGSGPAASDVLSWTFVDGDDPMKSFRARGFTADTRSAQTFNLHSGDLISDVILAAIGGTSQGQVYAVRADGQDLGDLSDGSYRAAGYFRVYPQVVHTMYDNATNNYVSTITYYIKMYKSQATKLRTAEIVNATQNQEACINDISSYGGLRKVYEWLFTGLNTEVLEFSPRFSFAFSNRLPFDYGFNASPETIEPQAQANTYRSNIPTLKAADQQIDQSAVQQQVTSTQNAQQITIGGGRQQTSANTQTSTVYAEDVIAAQENGNPFPVAIQQGGSFTKEAAGTGLQIGYDRRRSIFASIMQQIHSPQKNLMNIELTVKGDPYWLGMDYNTMLTSQASDHSLPNWSLGDIGYVLRFKYPRGNSDNDNIGIPNMRNGNVFTGLYRVTGVRTIFEGGMFKHVLTSVRIESVTPLKAANIADSAKSTTSSTSSSTSSSSGTTQ